MSAPTASPPASPHGPGAGMDEWERALDALQRAAAAAVSDFEARAEIQETRQSTWSRGALRGAGESRIAGLALRVWERGGEGFASTHDPSPAGVRALVDHARRLARHNAADGAGGFPYAPGRSGRVTRRPDLRRDPASEAPDAAADLLRRAHDAAAEADPTANVRASFGTLRRRLLLVNGVGRRADATTSLSTLLCAAVHRDGDRLGDAVPWLAGERGLDDFEDEGGPEGLGRRAAEEAREAAGARAAPAGRQRVLCDPALSGVLAHESFGHLTEYDLVAMDWSVLHRRHAERFAGDHVSVLDAPEVPGAPRTGLRLPVDDEGTRGEAVRILDRGVLANFLHARGSADERGVAPTGNARALDARFAPLVRQRNTFFEPGDRTLEEALEALRDGVYLIGGRGGAPAADGSFMFTSVRGYRVAGGRLREPLRTTAVSGNILDFLRNVELCTRDLRVEATNFGGCGKWGQSFLPVGMGGPHVLVAEALVGGGGA